MIGVSEKQRCTSLVAIGMLRLIVCGRNMSWNEVVSGQMQVVEPRLRGSPGWRREPGSLFNAVVWILYSYTHSALWLCAKSKSKCRLQKRPVLEFSCEACCLCLDVPSTYHTYLFPMSRSTLESMIPSFSPSISNLSYEPALSELNSPIFLAKSIVAPTAPKPGFLADALHQYILRPYFFQPRPSSPQEGHVAPSIPNPSPRPLAPASPSARACNRATHFLLSLLPQLHSHRTESSAPKAWR